MILEKGKAIEEKQEPVEGEKLMVALKSKWAYNIKKEGGMSRPLIPHDGLQRLAHPPSVRFHFFLRLMHGPTILRFIPPVAVASALSWPSRQVSTGKEARQRSQSRYQHLHYHAPRAFLVITGICRIVVHAVFVLKHGHLLLGVSYINNV